MQNQTTIQLENITKSYGEMKALDLQSFTASSRERIALIGPSGAGKSTLLNILAGNIQADQGTYSIDGQSFSSLNRKERSRCIGMIRQQFDLVLPLKVIHNVLAGNLGRWSLGKSLLSLIIPQDKKDAIKALEKVGLLHKVEEKTSVLSGGEQQRVAMARLLVQNPAVVLADEPVASLDPARADQILELLVNLTNSGDQTLIASLHSIELAKKHFTRVVGLRDGRVYLNKSVSELTNEDILALYDLENGAYE